MVWLCARILIFAQAGAGGADDKARQNLTTGIIVKI
jgi:hypothetical protein